MKHSDPIAVAESIVELTTPLAWLEEIGNVVGVYVCGDEPIELADWRTMDDGLDHGITCACCEVDELRGDEWKARVDRLRAGASVPFPGAVEIVARFADLLGVPVRVYA